jgi:chromosome partitioning protein
MIITVASFKGGVGKTTTAVHLAAYLNKKKPALLIDGDPNRSATKWNARGRLPFKVIDERQAARFARDFEHIVIDTEARPDEEDLRSLATGCDLLVIPTTPDAMALDALLLTVEAIEMLTSKNLPIFKGYINRRVAFQKASLNGTIVAEVKDAKSEQAWREYEMVGKEIMKMQKGGQ